jgi:hypothetical protein
MKYVIKKKWIACGTVLIVLLIASVSCLLFIISRNNYQVAEISVNHISQIPRIGQYLKGMNSEDGVKYIEKNTLGTIEILFTGRISNENMKHFYENNQWYHISAKAEKGSLGNIYKDFNVGAKEYPLGYTEEDIIIDKPLFDKTKVIINYMPKTNCFTGKVIIYNR